MAREATVTVAYVPFKTFETALDTLRQGIPDPVDKSVFRNQSFSTQNMLLSSLKALGAIDDDGHPQAILPRLVDPSSRKGALKELMEDKYRSVLDLGLAATDKQVEDKLRERGVGGETLNKAKAFFLRATAAAGIPLSPHIKGARMASNGDGESGSAPRQPGAKRRRRTQKPGANPPAPPGAPTPQGTVAATWMLSNGGTATLYVTGDPFSLPKKESDDLFSLADKMKSSKADSPTDPTAQRQPSGEATAE